MTYARNLNYLKSINSDYIEELWQAFQSDPESVDESWRRFFEGVELGQDFAEHFGVGTAKAEKDFSESEVGQYLKAESQVAELIVTYRNRGILMANINPLQEPIKSHPFLDLEKFSLSSADLSKTFSAGQIIGLPRATLNDILERLKQTYCSTIGVEVSYIKDAEPRDWLHQKMESCLNKEAFSAQSKKYILKRIAESQGFENFIHTRYVAQKRFSIEGAESLVPALDRIISSAADLGAEQFVMGMAHRGRLNVLTNIFKKAPQYIFTEFEESYDDEKGEGVGDVKYHMGYSADIVTDTGKKVHLSLAHNPSHLEFVNPIVEGIARAKQLRYDDHDCQKVIPLLIHGDAAFAGQGVVYETLNFSQVKGFHTGGTIHIVINNQVGFTTNPDSARSTAYATDVAKMLEVPIFHVNGDDPEALCYVAKLAVEYRQKFKKDVFIDLICYRKYGHNEGDEPSYTQPLMYKKIKTHPTVFEVYAKKLVGEGVLSDAEVKSCMEEVVTFLEKAQAVTREQRPKPINLAYEDKWKNFTSAKEGDIFKTVSTRVSRAQLVDLATKITTFPSTFQHHHKLTKMLEERRSSVEKGEGIDWGTGEALAFATLLTEGHPVRMTGQDCERGTFSHRHAVLCDVNTGEKFTSLNHLNPGQAKLLIRNSTLSEQGVLGFEYGLSLADPEALGIWEAQFGDFCNVAQVIFDQFLSASESKWARSSGLVILLPHGYEGQGPEHSSARLERFLQLCGQYNMTVCNFTKPSQMFHALRRQVKRTFRKPLVVMTPKSLLRAKNSFSTIAEFSDQDFQYVLDDPKFVSGDNSSVKRLLICTGKVFYDLMEEREKNSNQHTAILRLEQLYPFPEEALAALINSYTGAKEIVWVQEEPRNMGAWSYVAGQWSGILGDFAKQVGSRSISYVGRPISAAPCNGGHRAHVLKQKQIVEAAFKTA